MESLTWFSQHKLVMQKQSIFIISEVDCQELMISLIWHTNEGYSPVVYLSLDKLGDRHLRDTFSFLPQEGDAHPQIFEGFCMVLLYRYTHYFWNSYLVQF